MGSIRSPYQGAQVRAVITNLSNSLLSKDNVINNCVKTNFKSNFLGTDLSARAKKLVFGRGFKIIE